MTKQMTVGELFTQEEVERAEALYASCPAGTFATRCAKEIVEPVIARINRAAGQENDPKYLAYAFEYAFAQRAGPRM